MFLVNVVHVNRVCVYTVLGTNFIRLLLDKNMKFDLRCM
jgi:hypothetical protein